MSAIVEPPEKMPRLVAELNAQHVRRSLGAGGFTESAKLEQAIKTKTWGGWGMVGERLDLPFGEVCAVKQGRYLGLGDMSEVKSELSPIPVIGANGVLGYTDRPSYEEPVTLVTCRGSNCGRLQRTAGPTWISNNAMACPRGSRATAAIFTTFSKRPILVT
ncbi:MAG: hypothetical protein KDM91_06445 [Verrucomicrobiae bacterium]|nr:hypothetical protein [Verrucomicrobiae bacterium]MCP5540246.1 hypothetical protein [Akkermansiaceae bacterium]